MISNILSFFDFPFILFSFPTYALLCLEIYVLNKKWKLKIIIITMIKVINILIFSFCSKFMGDLMTAIVHPTYYFLSIYYFIIFLYRKYKQKNIKQ